MEGSVLDVTVPENYFDIVMLNGVLEWVGYEKKNAEDIQLKVLKKALSSLKDTGFLYFAIENRWFPFNFFEDPHQHLPFMCVLPRPLAHLTSYLMRGKPYDTPIYSYWGFINLLKKTGFKKIKAYFPFINYQYPAAVLDLDKNETLTDEHVKNIREKYVKLGVDKGVNSKITYSKLILKLGLTKLFIKSFIFFAEK
jgi:SAM-dependent methyltransferase